MRLGGDMDVCLTFRTSLDVGTVIVAPGGHRRIDRSAES